MTMTESDVVSLPKPNYQYITREEDVAKAVENIVRYPRLPIDTEATDLDPYKAKVTLVQIGIPNFAYVFDVRHDTEHSSVHMSMLDPVLKNPNIKKVLQNSTFDMKLIKLARGYYLENIYDTMLAEQLFNLGISMRGADLGSLVLKYLGLSINKEPSNTFSDYNKVFEPYQLEYAANDVLILNEIMDSQAGLIKKHGFEDVSRLEFEFTIPMCEMELNGITIDVDMWKDMMVETEKERDELKDVVSRFLTEKEDQQALFGKSMINLDSPVQLKKSLPKFGVTLKDTSVGSLSKHRGNPIIDKLLLYRKVQKLVSTYGQALLDRINPVTGRLHTSFRQMVSTGRMSSSRPNLQNVPKKQKYRSGFVAKNDDYVLITADMSGAELRILGNVSEDPIFIDCYANGIDLHTRTAQEVFGDSHRRGDAKAINFGLCVQENSLITTSNGLIEIKDAEIHYDSAHDFGNNKIIDKKCMGEKEVFEIETKYGYTLELTENHLVKVIDGNGKYIDKELRFVDIEKDYVCLKSGSNIFPKNDFIFDEFSVEKLTNYKHFSLPKKIDKYWSSFLGLFVSEGSVFKIKDRDKYSTVSFGFSKDNEEFIEKIDRLFYKLFGDRVSKTEHKYKRYTINSVLFSEWLSDITEIRHINKTDSIRVPLCIRKSTMNQQSEFIRWLFEGDGSVKKNGNGYAVTYSSKSVALLKDLQTMLLNFGVLSSTRSESRKYYDDLYYELRIVGHDSLKIFKDAIGFVTSHKNNKCVDNVKKYNSCYYLTNQTETLKRLHSKYISGGIKSNTSLYNTIYNCMNYTDGIGNIGIERLSKYDNFIKFIYENNIVILPVKSIKSKGIKKVYDISVENHPYFLANGFIVHNCYGLTKYGLSKRLNISENDADFMINKYFDRYSGVKKYLDRSGRDGIRKRYSRTVSGRKRFYNLPPYSHPEYKTQSRAVERQAKNAGIQGANADTIKQSMIYLVDRLEKGNYDAKLVLTVHDEVVVECHKDQKYEVAGVVSQSLIDGFGRYFSLIPMETDAMIGPCWLKNCCENESTGKECGGTEMKFIIENGKKKLVCGTCGAAQ